MNRFDWLSEYLARLEDEHVVVPSGNTQSLAPAHLLIIDPEDWAKVAVVAKQMGLRWAAIWGDEQDHDIVLTVVLVYQGDYIALRTAMTGDHPVIASHTPVYAAADRMERHLADMLGVQFDGHPDPRRWTRHRAWEADEYPLRAHFPAAGQGNGLTPADSDYPFPPIQGSGVYEIPVGPVHAGIIEPGHFRFQAAGEPILRLEERLGYVHKGIEKRAIGRDAEGLARLAARISGDSTVAHSWAACQALERACHVKIPAKASLIRGLLCERERVANHLGDIGAICNDVGFAFAQMQCQALREQWLRHSLTLTGHRLMMDVVLPGGVRVDIDQAGRELLRAEHVWLREQIGPLFDILNDHPSLEDRLLSSGYLSPASAAELGVSGYVGKASGQAVDLRKDSPYAPYSRLSFSVALSEAGDVAARMAIRQQEIYSSLELMNEMLDILENTAESEPTQVKLAPILGAEGLGLIDGWRGEIISHVRLDDKGRIAHFFARDPSWFSWPALERIVLGNIVPDFPVCNKSVNASYSGQDL
ncbi:MAG: NADH-quinone oxidoreductase subunit C [gamma proteobacterium symbiont of Bathyaustriella thionipta]|nr:NADH-quinone oxidoreductase subunit C [gamma proteobacterium symbiont of Bathyaustriella thionipta]